MSAAKPRPTVAAFYCPLWHRYPHLDSWKGEGWTEWELLKTAPRRFKGHYQPYRPSWGCFDESDPKWAAREIDLAADHGVDVFLFDWYWFSGVKLMEEGLEGGFLRAPNRKRLRFALMWANHHWWDYFPAPLKGPWNWWLPMRHSPRDFERVIDYCIEHYFRQPNYWRLQDKLFFSLFHPALLIEHLGGTENTRRLLGQMDRRLHARGLPSIHWNAIARGAREVPALSAAGFQSTTEYNIIASGRLKPQDNPVDQYEDLMAAHRKSWQTMGRTRLPYLPIVTMGWDVTPRCQREVPWPFPRMRRLAPGHPSGLVNAHGQRVYPYIHVVVGNTPKRFAKLCRDAAQHLQAIGAEHPVVMVNSWNEWTEGSFLLPEKRYGKGYLEAIRSVFGVAQRGTD